MQINRASRSRWASCECVMWCRYIQPSYRLEHMLRTLKDAGKKLFSESKATRLIRVYARGYVDKPFITEQKMQTLTWVEHELVRFPFP